MQAERVILETDENGRLSGLPQLPPGVKVEAIFVVLDSETTGQHKQSAEAAPPGAPPESPVEILKRIAAIAEPVPDDGFSGEDHDRVLYGWVKPK